ncbi:endonuclease G, mitochondrial [Microplitis mediator]|uniref:endonuclease G, mitochondrial n=1 Tax=Microplitis mediator TaxID=375433 RepID=UPI0025547FC8|nr:endonuclease G, mitochondrial [Microplitis mediator]
MTAKRLFVKLSALASASIGGWYAGKYYERNHHDQEFFTNQGDGMNLNLKRMPGLPIFGSVSAAVPMVPSDSDSSKVSTSRVSQIMKYGFPSLDNIRSFDDFVLAYDRRNRVAHWVFEHLSKETLKCAEDVNRALCEFKSDESVHPFFRATNSDYKGSGYDRGHMAAAGNHKNCQKNIQQTFFLSNIAPQVGAGFNRNSWNRLEKYVRNLTKIYKDVYVCTGPLYLPKREGDGKKYIKYEVIGTNHVAVPTHFFKVIVCETHDSKYEMEVYVMPNTAIDDDTPLKKFHVPPESVERASGLLFFDRISREKLSKVNGQKK